LYVYQVRWCGSISCCLYRLMFVERPSVCVLASVMDDCFGLLWDSVAKLTYINLVNYKINHIE